MEINLYCNHSFDRNQIKSAVCKKTISRIMVWHSTKSKFSTDYKLEMFLKEKLCSHMSVVLQNKTLNEPLHHNNH